MSLKLDKRIKDRDDIQSLLNYDRSLIGQTGYFANDLSCFSDLGWCRKDVLSDIIDTDEDGNELDFEEDTIFVTEDKNYRYAWSFFIPEASLLTEELEVRPFTSEEWKSKFKIGTVLKFRAKGEKYYSELMYLGFENTSLGLNVIIGTSYCILEDLSESYEYFDEDSKKWVPFGVVM